MPFHGLFATMHQCAHSLGQGGIEQVGAHGGLRMHLEQQDQQRRHERTTAHAGHAHKEANAKAGENIKQVDGFKQGHGGGLSVSDRLALKTR